MMSDTHDKPFDCVRWTRERRDQMYRESKDMTPEERALRSRRPTDPFLAELYDRAKPPTDSSRHSRGGASAGSTVDNAHATGG